MNDNSWSNRIFRFLPLSDQSFCQIQYYKVFHKFINLKNPKTFNEKIQLRKINHIYDKYSNLVDKFEARKYVSEIIGIEYLNELFGLYCSLDELNFESLPNQFVIKATHGSGWNYICNDKSKLHKREVLKLIKSWLSSNYYRYSREAIYKNIPPRIIIEKYLENSEFGCLLDYKLFCFHGKVKFIRVNVDKQTGLKSNFYDLKWNLLPFEIHFPNIPKIIQKPDTLNIMIEIAEKLSHNMEFVRVDLYEVNKRIFFGELTFLPEAGLNRFNPPEWDLIIGDYL